MNEDIKGILINLRNELYENLPSGDVDGFELIKVIKKHIKNLDNIINTIEVKE